MHSNAVILQQSNVTLKALNRQMQVRGFTL
ncbi:hypothetical protein RDI58_007191 [Solanum bulbocastanum]|uniref:Uncharacterized protein n=1 Tax=Solanum bulbocastanum TaxID=147425 RepID=A0AAN8YLW3_SOLBU